MRAAGELPGCSTAFRYAAGSSRWEAGEIARNDLDRPGREVNHDHESRPEAIAGGVRQDVGEPEHLDLAVEDIAVRPVADEPGRTRRDRPFARGDDATVVLVNERCSGDRDRMNVAGARIHD